MLNIYHLHMLQRRDFVTCREWWISLVPTDLTHVKLTVAFPAI